jgi:hypothetical protein
VFLAIEHGHVLEAPLQERGDQGRRAAADVNHAAGGGDAGRVEHPQRHLGGGLKPAAHGVAVGIGLIPVRSRPRLRCHLAIMPGQPGQANRLRREVW